MHATKQMGLILLVLIAALVLATFAAWWLDADPLAPGNWSGRANEAIGPWRTLSMLVRWAVWGVLWWRWEQLGQRLFRGHTHLVVTQRQQWAGMRTRMMGGIAVVEILILITSVTGESGWV